MPKPKKSVPAKPPKISNLSPREVRQPDSVKPKEPPKNRGNK